MTNFITTSQSSGKDFFKKSLPFLGAGLLAIVLFSILFFVPKISSNVSCSEVANTTKITRCENKFKQIIFIIADTANTPKPTFDNEYINVVKEMYDGDEYGISYISVSDPTAAPKTIELGSSIRYEIDNIKDSLSQMKAEKNGADYLEAIRTAIRYSDDKEHTLIYIIGSGLSDSGLLDFANDKLLTTKSTDGIIASLEKKIENKNELDGVTIVWNKMGETTEPQKPLNNTLKNKEQTIYKEALKKFGIDEKSLFIVNKSSSSNDKNNVSSSVKTTPVKDENLTFVWSNDNSKLAFIPDTNHFVNENEAKEEMKRFVNEHSDYYFVVTSYMSRGWCDNDEDTELIKSRSEATKELLMDVGVSEEDIIIEDGGIGNANECPRGLIHEPADPVEAQKNRIVVISLIRK